MSAIQETPVRVEEEAAAKVERVPYRADDAPKIKEPRAPEDFDPKVHISLRRTDFVDDAVYLDYRANECDARAAKYRAEAETIRKLGSASDRNKAKKLMSMQQRMAELARELSADGNVDLASILGAEQAAALLGSNENKS